MLDTLLYNYNDNDGDSGDTSFTSKALKKSIALFVRCYNS